VLNLFNRGIDFAFAFVMLRVLGPTDAGIYAYAGVVFVWFDIFTNFGLNLYLTRAVARDRAAAASSLINTSVLRLLLVIAGVPLLLGFIGLRQLSDPPLTPEALLAIALLYVGLIPSTISTGLAALFYAFEEAEIPAVVTTVATINKAIFGLAALLIGFGVIGLAGVSILTNLLTLAILALSARRLLRGQPVFRRPQPRLMRGMIGTSWPLMLNHFLATIFFQIDIIIIELIHGARMVGQYSVAYKWLLALNIIPAFFTQALLPVMSRQAESDRGALLRSYRLGLKLLISLALPVAVAFTFLAEFLTGILGGAAYLPDSAIATQIMIWSIPVGWLNSLTQYVLIALDLQRRVTTAFIIGVTFNIVANLALIPQFGYRAAALTTIASEIVLLIPFALILGRALGPIRWIEIVWRPVIAAAAMLAVMSVGWAWQPALALVSGGLIYVGVLLLLRPLDTDERAVIAPLLPARLRGARLLSR
ncbi:MAG: flippase, partial [Chloroflexi bacterium]|nr:flippase [Chloroflexota bacterium]